MTDAPEYADPDRYIELAGFTGEWRDLFWNHDFLSLMARRWRLAEVRDALDVGCGAGHWGRALIRHLPAAARVTGVDLEVRFCELARHEAAARGLDERLDYLQGGVEALPFPADSFDLVTCQTLLIHVADVEAALTEMIRVTRPGGLVALAEPDNRAGNLALLNQSPRLRAEDVAELLCTQLVCERGKQRLGEGDDSIGGRLPGIVRQLGLRDVRAHVNDRCIELAPPYDAPAMRVALAQERAWAAEDITTLLGTHHDARRRYLAGGGDQAGFARGWAAALRWLRAFERDVDAGRYYAARGYVMYLVSGRKPEASAT
ncbi:MAG: methyltransferase domain-containing protein [Myxococcales bacterium]|nr:methyltransferase domain-containing protein [Myxococcales bacterium]